MTTMISLSAAALATVASLALTGGPQRAQADPGDTVVPIGSSRLVQSEDLSSIQVPLDRAAVVLNRDDDFSSCLGEGNPWTRVLKGSPKPIKVTWTRQSRTDQALYESIAQAKTPAQAAAYAKTLLDRGVRDCQRPVYDFHFGKITSFRVGSGYASVALSYRGKQKRPDGGVVVIRQGVNVGFVEYTGSWGPADQTAESIAKVAVSRLG